MRNETHALAPESSIGGHGDNLCMGPGPWDSAPRSKKMCPTRYSRLFWWTRRGGYPQRPLYAL